ncbi:unnamed protein product [Rotaria magnacalcarata]|uniref:Uncharacterized protein n=1 Tax=Rotaria magnacalcarata TaxID=392030 RepID=A0A816H4V0_9BILA|nr:unnamed protein product [Rotaria magnacalcarata]CAF1683150.1 unnamed protein product [Rotaria magnacalcarata]CAF2154894.1 unnamed protein product [Rotaria magnacalcarata]CAF3837979.1 unnamed protein product [Rotaria magnacalcarata]CAF3838709.1 unnamed protein product [Rotaria magnacalcarata]
MDDLSLFPISNGKHYSNDNDSEIFDEEENEQPLNEIQLPPQQHKTIQNERGGRRKGVPRRLQLSPEIIKPPTQRLLPLTLPKTPTASVHHHEQPILTSDQEDENDIEGVYHQNQIEQNYLQLNLLSKHFVDNNNNNQLEESEDILEVVDDILADLVTIIVKDIKEQRKKPMIKTNGHSHPKKSMNTIPKMTNGKHNTNGLSNKSKPLASALKFSDRTKILNDLTKAMTSNAQQQLAKHKLSPSSSSFSSPSTIKRQKTSEISSQSSASLSMQQQLLWEMTQQLMMSSSSNEADSLAAVNSSLLKQQLLGLTQPDAIPKRSNRPAKPEVQSLGMSANASVAQHTSHNSTSPSLFERGNFAPRRRGRPPKYVTDRGLTGLSSLDLDPSSLTSSYDQLFAAIENGMGANTGTSSAATFQSALASMLGQQAGLSIPSSPPVSRNGAPASLVKNSAGQTRHSLPGQSMSSASKIPVDIGGIGLDMPMLAAKKRGPGRPPKSQILFDPHQILQATQRLNSPTHSNNYPPTMVPSSPTSFDLNAAFVEMLQQQQH